MIRAAEHQSCPPSDVAITHAIDHEIPFLSDWRWRVVLPGFMTGVNPRYLEMKFQRPGYTFGGGANLRE